jgi:predicted TIM-barrel fold metal-dependent hydrolase
MERARKAFGRPRSELSAEEIKAFEDFIMWKLAELSAKYDMPLQIHTGTGQLPGSNPMNLVNLIQGNPNTKFILFHGGIPWVSECAVIAYRHPRNVWLDANWMPILSYTMAKRALHEWLDLISSNRIMWGGDSVTAEAIYGATDRMRSCVAEVLTERTESGNLTPQQAQRIGRQIFRENALALFPQLKDRLWKEKGTLPPAPIIRGLQTSHQ